MNKIAFFDSSHDLPEEIISAAGYIPYKILGDVHASNEPADQYLQNFFCPAAKSFFTEALHKSGDWSGIVVAQGCNTTNRHFDVWKMHIKTPFLYWFNAPVKNDEIALGFMKKEIKAFIDALESFFKVKIGDDKIRESIRVANEIKKLLQKLSAMRSTKDIPNRDYLQAILVTLQQNRKDAVASLEQISREWSARPAFPSGKKKALLTGSDVSYPEWMDTLDKCDVRVVRDDLSIGERYFTGLIPESGDPIESLARYYLNIPRPATKPGLRGRIEFLKNILRTTPIDGIVSQNLKFCEPFAYDSVSVNNALKEDGHKLIHFEREFTPVTDQQIVTRLTAFTETL